MSKHILTKKQAVAVLIQAEKREGDIDLFMEVDKGHKYFKLSTEELEAKLDKYMGESLAAVVDEIESKKPKM